MGNARPISAAAPVSEDTGVIIPENCVAGNTVRIIVPKSAAVCVPVKDETSMPYPVAGGAGVQHVQLAQRGYVSGYGAAGARAEKECRKASLDRYVEHILGEEQQNREVANGKADVRQLLAKQKLQAGGRGDVEVRNRPKFFLPHDRERHEDGRDERQQQGDRAWHHCVDAVEILVVAETLYDARWFRRRRSGRL